METTDFYQGRNKKTFKKLIFLDKNIISPRPLTHDLFLTIAKNANLILDKIIIHKLEKGIFFSSVVFVDTKTNKKFNIDARTSDAIAIAIRFNAPIYSYKEILEKANNYLKEESRQQTKNKETVKAKKLTLNKTTTSFDLDELEKKLHTAIENEDYELAAKIRDQIKKINE